MRDIYKVSLLGVCLLGVAISLDAQEQKQPSATELSKNETPGKEQNVPRDVAMQRKIQKIEDPTQKYMEYLRLSARTPNSDISFQLPRRRR